MSDLTIPEKPSVPPPPSPRWGVRIYRAAVIGLLAIIAWNASNGEFTLIVAAFGLLGVLFGRD